MAVSRRNKEEIIGYKTYYREVGYYLLLFKEQFLRALNYFDDAISRTPDDIRALIGRSQCRAKAARYKGALEDINRALALDPDDLLVRGQKALNTYLVCEFEEALLQNLRYVPFRKKPDNFVMGVMHCTEAIENCIGKRAGNPLRDHFRIIRTLAWKKAYEAKKPFQAVSKFAKRRRKKIKRMRRKLKPPKAPMSLSFLGADVSHIEVERGVDEDSAQRTEGGLSWSALGDPSLATTVTGISAKVDDEMQIRDTLYTRSEEKEYIPRGPSFPFRPLQRHTTNLRNYMAEKYLGVMYLDKIFLENIHNLPDIHGPNQEGCNKILNMTMKGLKTLCYKQELLRTRRPFYFLKYQEATSCGALQKRQEEEMRKLREITKHEAEKILAKIINAIKHGNTILVLELAEKLKKYCDTKSKKTLPEKDLFLQKMYDLVCQGHYSLKRLNPEQTSLDQEKRIFVMFGLPISRPPSKDSVIKQYQEAFVDYKKLIKLYEERVEMARTSQELAWLYHELAIFHFELRQFDLSRDFCRKCINEARLFENLRWIVNAMFVIVRINIQQKNRNDAKTELNNCLEIAKILNDENLQKFIVKCNSVFEEIDFETLRNTRLIKDRERQILGMMQDPEMKDEAAYLFRQMAGMPASRRMTVIPGVKVEDVTPPNRGARKKSVMQGGMQPPSQRVSVDSRGFPKGSESLTRTEG